MNKFKHSLFAIPRLPVAHTARASSGQRIKTRGPRRRVSPRCWLIAFISTMLLALTSAARANDPIPFKGTGEGSRQIIVTSQTTFIGIFDAQGEFTHFGNTRVHAQMLFMPNLGGSVHGMGTATFTVADGDQVEMNIEGDVNTTTGELAGTFTITGGTGRFAGTSGQGTFAGNEDAQGSFSVTFEGEISY